MASYYYILFIIVLYQIPEEKGDKRKFPRRLASQHQVLNILSGGVYLYHSWGVMPY